MFVKSLLVLLSLQLVLSCEHGWTGFGNKCYRLADQPGAFSEADSQCGRMIGRTLTIYSHEEQKFLERWLAEQKVSQPVWVGGHRENLIFAWRNDHIPIVCDVFANWAPEAPSKVFAKACMQMNVDGKWQDNFCFSRNAIVCERFRKLNDDNQDEDGENNIVATEKPSRPESCSCKKEIREAVEKLEKNLEKRIEKIQKEFKETIEEIAQRQDRQSREWLLFRMKEQEMFDEISGNFTGIATILGIYGQHLDSIYENIDSRAPNMDGIKEELLEFVADRINTDLLLNISPGVNDARLSYVNYRRALQIQKNGKWITLGFV